MNIKIKFIGAVSAVLLLTGCAGNTETESGSSSVSLSEISSETSSVSQASTSSTSSKSSTSSSISSSSLSSSSSEFVPVNVELPEDFRLSDYLSGFDDVKPMDYTVTSVNDNSCDQAVTDKAIAAYENSVYFAEALETAYNKFHIENGKLVPNIDIDEDDITSYLSLWGYGLSVNDNDDIVIETKAVGGITAKFDGVHDESIVILISFMPSSFFEWSGAAAAYYPVVYINSGGETSVIGVLSRQTLGAVNLIEFSDGTIHLMIGSGHTTGTQRTYIVSFADGKPVCELTLSGVLCADGIFYSYSDWSPKFPFFWDGEKYCGISGVKPSKELGRIICGNKNVLEAVPDAQKEYDDGKLVIIGGKYITFEHECVTFTVTDGGLEKSDLTVWSSDCQHFNRAELAEDTDKFDFGEEIELPLYNIVLD